MARRSVRPASDRAPRHGCSSTPGTSGPRATSSSRRATRPGYLEATARACRGARRSSRSQRGGRGRARAARVHRVLPSAVLPDPGERRVVGTRLHRVDQRRGGPAAVPRARQPSIPAELGFYDLREPETPGPRRRRCAASTASRRSATGTTGSAARACSSGRSTRCCARASPTRVLPRLGQPAMDRTWLGSGEVAHASSRTPPPTTSRTAGARGRRSPTRATSASTAGRCSPCTGPGICPIRPARVTPGGRSAPRQGSATRCSSPSTPSALASDMRFGQASKPRARTSAAPRSGLPHTPRTPGLRQLAVPFRGTCVFGVCLDFRGSRCTTTSSPPRLMDRRHRWITRRIPTMMVGWDDTPPQGRRGIVVLDSSVGDTPAIRPATPWPGVDRPARPKKRWCPRTRGTMGPRAGHELT